MKLTKNFHLDELKVSSDHPELARRIIFSSYEIYKAKALCELILQPVRDKFGQVKILSGKRSAELNDAVGGASTSHHLYKGPSAAADFTVPGADLETVYEYIRTELMYGECFHYPGRGFIHVALPTPNDFMQDGIL